MSLGAQRVGLLLLWNSFSLVIPAEHNNLAKTTQKCLWCSRSQSLMVLRQVCAANTLCHTLCMHYLQLDVTTTLLQPLCSIRSGSPVLHQCHPNFELGTVAQGAKACSWLCLKKLRTRISGHVCSSRFVRSMHTAAINFIRVVLRPMPPWQLHTHSQWNLVLRKG